jgi:hypothetical protein
VRGTSRVSILLASAIAVVAMAATAIWSTPASASPAPKTDGYVMLSGDGGIFAFGVPFAGSASTDTTRCAADACESIAMAPSGQGYWILNTTTGAIYPFGNVGYFGDGATFYQNIAPDLRPTKFLRVVPTPDGQGYWVYQTNAGVGQILTFGDAKWYGDTFGHFPWGTGHPPNGHPVGLTATADGKGYWEVWSDGGVFSFGDAKFYGSTGAMHLTRPIIGMTATADGKGYWLYAGDGGVFAFGDAKFSGSTGGIALVAPIVGMVRNPAGPGYWLAAADGGVFAFGGAPYLGALPQFGVHLRSPIVAVAARGATPV